MNIGRGQAVRKVNFIGDKNGQGDESFELDRLSVRNWNISRIMAEKLWWGGRDYECGMEVFI